jgi:hypothetical protein
MLSVSKDRKLRRTILFDSSDRGSADAENASETIPGI